jgi:hypothetical protein
MDVKTMNDITVTMPIQEYERMQKKIKRLEKERIYNFIEFQSVQAAGEPALNLTLFQEEIIDYIVNNQNGIANVFIKNRYGLNKIREIIKEGESNDIE